MAKGNTLIVLICLITTFYCTSTEQNTTEQVPTPKGSDKTAPTFTGVATVAALNQTVIRVGWQAAIDDTSPSASLIYKIFIATVSGGQDFSSATVTTSAYFLSYVIINLSVNTQYFIVVRVQDEAGNIDNNTIEKAITTLPDTQAPIFAGVTSASVLSGTDIRLYWALATDNITQSTNIIYEICQSATSGGCSTTFTTMHTTSGVVQYVVTGLSPSTTYYFVVRAKDEAGNTDNNIIQLSRTTFDIQPPVFLGLVSAIKFSPTRIDLVWSVATDDLTPQSLIFYDIYQATTIGGQNYAIPNYSVQGAIGYSVINLNPDTQYSFVVRARDGSWNRESNTIEKSAKTDPDILAPTFSGLLSSIDAGTGPSVTLAWSPATDDTTSQGGIVYQICQSLLAGNCQTSFVTTYTTNAGATIYNVSSLNRFTSYYFVVRAKDATGNIDTNTVEKNITTSIANSWLTKAVMPTPRYWLTGEEVAGKLYVFGGYLASMGTLSTNEEYDVVGNLWNSKASLPVARSGAASSTVMGKIYVFGGGPFNSTSTSNTVYEYDPVGNSWLTKSPMSFSRRWQTASAVSNKIYVIGGYTGTSAVFEVREYDPSTDTWTNCGTPAPGNNCAMMPGARFAAASCVVGNKIYVIGGENSGAQNSNYEYDPSSNTWVTKASMPGARATLGCGVINNKIYAIGGWAGGGFPQSSVFQYDLNTDTWQTKASLLGVRDALAVITYNKRIYAVGGGNGSALNQLQVFE